MAQQANLTEAVNLIRGLPELLAACADDLDAAEQRHAHGEIDDEERDRILRMSVLDTQQALSVLSGCLAQLWGLPASTYEED